MSFICCDTLGDPSPSRRSSHHFCSPEPRKLIKKLSMSVEEQSPPIANDSTDNAKNGDAIGEQLFHSKHRSPLRVVQHSSPSPSSARAFLIDGVGNAAERLRLHCSASPGSPHNYISWSSATPFNSKSPFGQIYSPLERMRLVSPTGSPKSCHTSNYVSDSDGFDFSEDLSSSEEMKAEPLSSALSSLVHSTNLSPLSEIQRGKLKRPCSGVSGHHSNKRPPLPFFSPPSNSSTPVRGFDSCSRNPLRGSVLFKTWSSPPIYPVGVNKEDGMIGDFTKSLILPIVKGKIQDLNCISADTLGSLLTGKISDITSFTIIDCRFPYEYEGGHIAGASNVWTDKEVKRVMFSKPVYPQSNNRDIVIFHCEFSSKRGPERSRFLREYDRRVHESCFPKLYYPELYLLEGGYRVFYEKYTDLCSPRGYCPMEDPAHSEELRACKLCLKQEKMRTCKLRSKTWNVEMDRSLT